MFRYMKRCMFAVILLIAVMIIPAAVDQDGARTAYGAERIEVGLMEGNQFRAQKSIDFGTVDLSKLDPQGESDPLKFQLAIHYSTEIGISDYLKIGFGFSGQAPLEDAFYMKESEMSGSTINKIVQTNIYLDPSRLTAGTYTANVSVTLPFDSISVSGSGYTVSGNILTIPIRITLTGDNPCITQKVRVIKAKAGNDQVEISWIPVEGCTSYAVFRREGTDESASFPELEEYLYLGSVRTYPEEDGKGFQDPHFTDYYAWNGQIYSYIVISDGDDTAFEGNASKSVSACPKAAIRLKPAAPEATAYSGSPDEVGLSWYWDAHGQQKDPVTGESDELTGNGQYEGTDLVDHFNVYMDGTLVRQVRRNAVRKQESGRYSWYLDLPAEYPDRSYTLWVTAVAPDGTEGNSSNKVIAYTEEERDLAIEGHTVRYIEEEERDDDTGKVIAIYRGLSIEISEKGADRLEIWRKPVSADDSAYEKVDLSITPDGETIDAGVIRGAVYTYKVIACDRNGRQTDPYIFSVAAAGEPSGYVPGGQPLEISLRTGNGADTTLYWSVHNEGTYRLYRDGKLLYAWDDPGSRIEYTDVLASDGDYNYYVIWTNDKFKGLAVRSNTCSFHRFTGDVDPAELDQAPGVPRLVSRIDGYGNVQLQWTPSDTGGRPDGYVIYREDGGVRNTEMWHNTWQHPLQEEDADGRYISRDANTTAYSVSGYYLWKDDGNDETTEDQSPHRFWITAYNGSGVSDPSEVIEYSAAGNGQAPAFEDPAAPNAPENISASMDLIYSPSSDRIGKLKIYWNGPKTGAAVSEYQITVNDGSRLKTSCPAESMQYDKDRRSCYAVEFDVYSSYDLIGKPMMITVSAVNDAGETAAESLTMTVEGIPQIEAEVTGTTSVKLQWTGLIGDTETEISEYQIWRRTSSSKWEKICVASPIDDRSYNDTGLVHGNIYEYCAVAVDKGGKQHRSKTIKVQTTLQDGEMMTPQDFRVQVVSGDVVLQWSMSDGGGMPVKYYLKYQETTDDPESDGWYSEQLMNASGDASGAVLTEEMYPNLWENYSGKELRLKIYAVSKEGVWSSPSDTAELIWPQLSDADRAKSWPDPVKPQVIAGDDQITLRWNKAGSGAEATYYLIGKINSGYYNPIYGVTYDSMHTVLPSEDGSMEWTDRDVVNGETYTYILLCCNSHWGRDSYYNRFNYDPKCEWNGVTAMPNGKTEDQKIADNIAAQAEDVLGTRPDPLSGMTEEYKGQVEELKENYGALTAYQKKLIGSDLCGQIEELFDAIVKLQEQEKYADDPRVITAISARTQENTTKTPVAADDPAYPAFAQAVERARTAFDDLPVDARSLVENLRILTDGENLIRQLTKAQADQAAADTFSAELLGLDLLPEDITEETLNDEMERNVADLRWEYDQLTKAQKALVSKEALMKLEALEEKVRQVQGIGHDHDMKRIGAVRPTCTDEGNMAYYRCESCGLYFLDPAGEQEVTFESVILPVDKEAHDWDSGTVMKAPTTEETGMIEYNCLLDPAHKRTEVIPKLDPVDPPVKEKMAQPMTVKSMKKTVKAKKLKKRSIVVKALTVKKNQGKVAYKVVGGKAKAKKALKVNKKTGRVTVKKKTKKGTYKIRVRVTAAGNADYKAGSKTVTVTVKVK